MRTASVPRLGPLYWLTISLASVFGTNTGDVMSHTLHLGNFLGLPVLALLFAAIVVAEGRAAVATPMYYWLAIIVMRTAATNLADLGTLQFELDYQGLIIAVALLIAALLLARTLLSGAAARAARRALPAGIPATGGVYWAAMLAAATLGTALGDFGAHTLTLRVASVASVALLAGALWLARGTTTDTPLYWTTIVIVRAAGTNIGDLIAFKRGLNLGLPLSTLVTGAVFLAAVVYGSRRRDLTTAAQVG